MGDVLCVSAGQREGGAVLCVSVVSWVGVQGRGAVGAVLCVNAEYRRGSCEVPRWMSLSTVSDAYSQLCHCPVSELLAPHTCSPAQSRRLQPYILSLPSSPHKPTVPTQLIYILSLYSSHTDSHTRTWQRPSQRLNPNKCQPLLCTPPLPAPVRGRGSRGFRVGPAPRE